MASNSIRLGFLAILALVALRLSVGWHFYSEGLKKYRDPDNFTSAYFLRQAKGPLADKFHELAPTFHGWAELLASPRRDDPPTEDEQAVIAGWKKDYADQTKQVTKTGKPPEEIVFPDHAPYKAWADQVADDWRGEVQRLIKAADLNEQQQEQAAETLQWRKWQLLNYLEDHSEEITGYRHDLYLLEGLEQDETAGEVPYQNTRISIKQVEVSAAVRPWVEEVKGFERALHADLERLLEESQRSASSVLARQGRLESIDRYVPYWHLAVGGLLIVGLFSRLAGFGAAVFLFSVIATQPPWVSGAADTHYQVVELFAALVLATVPTGRWGGLDWFIHALLSRCCTRSE